MEEEEEEGEHRPVSGKSAEKQWFEKDVSS